MVIFQERILNNDVKMSNTTQILPFSRLIP